MPFADGQLQAGMTALRRCGMPKADWMILRARSIAPCADVPQEDGSVVTEAYVTRPDAELAVMEAQLSDDDAIAALAYLMSLPRRTDARRDIDRALVKLVMSQAQGRFSK
jgi:hypothetical protein